MKKTLFANGTIVHADGVKSQDILIRGEQIISIGKNLESNADTQIIDCKNKLIFPGIIDPHTHMGIPIKGGFSADDFETGTRSALNGGVTTIIDFTILDNDQTLQESMYERHRLAEVSHSDYALHCNITRFSPSLLREIPKLIAHGIISFKVFTTYKEAGMMLTYEQITEVAKVIEEHNGILMVHAEDDAEITSALVPLMAENHVEPFYHGLSRPDSAEELAVKRLVAIAKETGCKIYIVHLNSEKGLNAAKKQQSIFIETCPHYLLLDDSVYKRKDGRMFVASPPLRKPSDSEALWEGIINGDIHTLGTDHCPFCTADKKEGIPFQNIPNGMGGVETLFPVMLAQWIVRDLPLPRLVELMSVAPATIFGLHPRKGEIAVGSDADLMVVDPKNITSSWKGKLVSVTDWNAYTEFPAIFPEQVWLRGERINAKEFTRDQKSGKFIHCN